jgi:signal transduction histidine kinase
MRVNPAKMTPMDSPPPASNRLLRSLSARLLVLTIFFVLVSELLIFVPSVAQFRMTYLEDKLSGAALALLALEAAPDNMVDQDLADELLRNVGAYSVMPEEHGHTSPKLEGVLRSRIPHTVQIAFDLRRTDVWSMFRDAFAAALRTDDRVMAVSGIAPREPGLPLQITLAERPMREAMLNFGSRIFETSLIISLLAAALVYVSLQWLLVVPMRRLTASMVAFRQDPEDAGRVIVPSGREDELGTAESELARLQETVRQALRQRARLAALGTAVTKINHDLKNILSTARLVSDRLAENPLPDVRRAAASVLSAIDRAVLLCAGTLAFTREGAAPLVPIRFPLAPLIAEMAAALPVTPTDFRLENLAEGAEIEADRDQLFRVLFNLACNAIEAEANRLSFQASPADTGGLALDIADNGHGLPPRARENLFQPFAGSARPGGTGLGLAICREIARAHGGTLQLLESSGAGTIFRLTLPRGWCAAE